MAANIYIEEVNVPTTTGNFEVKIPGIGTPQAVRMDIVSAATNGTQGAGMQLSRGFCDGAREWVNVTSSRDNQATSDCGRRATSDEIGMIIGFTDPTSILFECSGVGDGAGSNPGPITDGWRFNVGSAAGFVAYKAKVTFFVGFEEFHVGITPALGNQNVATDITAPTFEPTFGYLGSVGDGIADSGASAGIHTQGMFHNGTSLKQKCISFGADDNQASASFCHTLFHSNRATAQVLDTDGVITWSGEVAIIANGFSITVRDGNSGGDKVGYAVFKTSDNVWMDVIDSPTDAGVDWTVSAPGFTPTFIETIQSYAQAEDSVELDIDALSVGFGYYDGTRQHCLCITDEDAATTTKAKALPDNQFMNLLDTDATVGFDMISPAFNANGWTVEAANIAAVNTTGRKWIGFALGAAGGIQPTNEYYNRLLAG